MSKKNKLYQCPYELACKCDLLEPCLGCETWAEHYRTLINKSQQLKNEISNIADKLDHAWSHNLLMVVKESVYKLRSLSI